MPATYSVTLFNDSELDHAPTFVIFATLPVQSANDTGVLAWLTQIVPSQWHQVFTWSMTWQFAVSNTRVATGCIWCPSFALPADPDAPEGCASLLSMDPGGALDMRLIKTAPDGTSLTIVQSADVPTPDAMPVSVAVGLSGSPLAATDAGPSLVTTFTTVPTYSIAVGDVVSGQVIDVERLATRQELPFGPDVTSLVVTLDKDNTWTVQQPSEVDVAELFAARHGAGGR